MGSSLYTALSFNCITQYLPHISAESVNLFIHKEVLRHLTASRSYLENGQYEKAVSELKAAVAIAPESYETKIRLADLYKRCCNRLANVLIFESM